MPPFIPRIRGDAFGREPSSYDGLCRLAARYAQDELAGLTLANRPTQHAITLPAQALAPATKPGSPAALLRAISERPSLLSHAPYVRTVADRHRRPEVRRVHLGHAACAPDADSATPPELDNFVGGADDAESPRVIGISTRRITSEIRNILAGRIWMEFWTPSGRPRPARG